MGVDPLLATELMDLLGIYPDDFIDQRRFEKFKDVARYIGKFENYQYMIKKLTLAKNVDKLTHIWEWCELSKQKADADSQIDSVSLEDSEMTGMVNNREGMEKLSKIQNLLKENINKSSKLDEEMKLYG